MILQSYEVTFEYLPGKKNIAADDLCRNSNTKINTEKCLSLQELVALDETQISTDQRKDKTWQEIIK